MFHLLPETLIHRIRSLYRWRCVAVGLGGVAVTFIVGSLVLLPSFVYSHITEAQLLEKKERIISSEEEENKGATEELRMWQSRVRILSDDHQWQPDISDHIETITETAGDSIKVRGIQFTDASSETLTIIIEGVALRRDDLRSFQSALEERKEFGDIHLPLSHFAEDTDITFSLTVTLRTEESQ